MTTPYLKLERRIAVGERGGVVDRWRYGRSLLEAKAGRKQLPHGMVAGLIKAAERAGFKLSEREIRRRVQCAETYDSEAKVGQALADFGTWSALAEAGFPPVEVDGRDPDDIEAEGLGHAPDSWEQLQLDIPGLKPILSVRGRRVALVRCEGRRRRDLPADVRADARELRQDRGPGPAVPPGDARGLRW